MEDCVYVKNINIWLQAYYKDQPSLIDPNLLLSRCRLTVIPTVRFNIFYFIDELIGIWLIFFLVMPLVLSTYSCCVSTITPSIKKGVNEQIDANGKCIVIKRVNRMSVVLFRLRSGNQISSDHSAPFGHILKIIFSSDWEKMMSGGQVHSSSCGMNLLNCAKSEGQPLCSL